MCLYLGGMRSSNWEFYWNCTSRSKSGNYSRWAYSAFISCSKNMNYCIINSHTTAMSTHSKTWTIWYAISTQLHQAFEQQTSHLDRIRKAMRVQRVTSGIRRTLRINLRAVSGHGILDCYSVLIPSRIRVWEVIDPRGCTSCLLAYFLTALLLACLEGMQPSGWEPKYLQSLTVQCNNGPPFTDVFANHMLTLNAHENITLQHTYCCRKLRDKISMTIMT